MGGEGGRVKWAVMGASGFIGSRFVEKMVLTQAGSVRPIVRSFTSLARLSRFDLDWRVTDLADVDKLTAAFEGCEVLLHSVVGNERVIVEAVLPVYEAAKRAGIRRIVYLSSASVYGLGPDPSTSDATPLPVHHARGYVRAKIEAEHLWAQARQTGDVEFVGLRPSIVFGPRSRWCADLAREALNGTAYLLQGGTGICNTIYVDNLIDAIVRAAQAENVDGHYFFVRDSECVTWADFYRPILKSCGVSMDQIHQVAAPEFKRSWRANLANVRSSAAVQAMLPLVPRAAKRIGKALLGAISASAESNPFQREGTKGPDVTEEMVGLQQCRWQMPTAKAEKFLGYYPPVGFSEGMRRSVGWLQFAGYPVQHRDPL